jgi:hypothetical protein
MKLIGPLVGLAFSVALLPAAGTLSQAPPEANEDESKVPPYTLPDPLVLADGRKASDARTWTGKRRPELLRLFETHVYGRTPSGGPRPRFEIGKTDPSALGGRVRVNSGITGPCWLRSFASANTSTCLLARFVRQEWRNDRPMLGRSEGPKT